MCESWRWGRVVLYLEVVSLLIIILLVNGSYCLEKVVKHVSREQPRKAVEQSKKACKQRYYSHDKPSVFY